MSFSKYKYSIGAYEPFIGQNHEIFEFENVYGEDTYKYIDFLLFSKYRSLPWNQNTKEKILILIITFFHYSSFVFSISCTHYICDYIIRGFGGLIETSYSLTCMSTFLFFFHILVCLFCIYQLYTYYTEHENYLMIGCTILPIFHCFLNYIVFIRKPIIFYLHDSSFFNSLTG
jgi:hypothetical protein